MSIDFSTRETALSLWLVILFAFILKNKVLRDGLLAVIKVIFMRRMAKWAILMTAYVSFLCYALTKIHLWNTSDLKATTLWLISAGFYMVYRAVKETPSPSSLIKDIFRNGFNISVVLEFLIGTAPFPFLVEFALIPMGAFFAFIASPSKTDGDNELLAIKLANSALTLFGFLMVSYALVKTIIQWNDFWHPQTAHAFILPLALSIAFIPFLWVLLTYLAYEHPFIRLQSIVKAPRRITIFKLQMIREFGIRYHEVNNWWRYYVRTRPENHQELIESLAKSRNSSSLGTAEEAEYKI